MSRTTLDIEPSVLAELKRRQRHEGKSLGRIVSELLAAGFDAAPPPEPQAFTWRAKPLGLRIDLDDKEAVRRALEA